MLSIEMLDYLRLSDRVKAASASASRIETVRSELSLALTGHAKLSRQAVRDMVIELGKIAEDLRLLERAPRSSVPLLGSAHGHAIG